MTSVADSHATPAVELVDVGFAYPSGGARGRPFALAGVSAVVARGEVLGVIGPNSAGKTTLIRLLTRVLLPLHGEIRLDGRPLARVSRCELARAVAVVHQALPPSLPFTVEQLVLMGRYPHAPDRLFESAADLAVAREAMRATGVLALADAPFDALGGGERQRAVLARALAQEPRLLVLDEPTAHLDLRHQVEFAALLRRLNREQGLTIVLVSHDLALAAELADRLLLLDRGTVARLGAPADVLDEALLGAVYGCRVIVDKHPESGRFTVHVAWADAPAERR